MKIPDNRSYPLCDYRTDREWHIYYVFNDPDFIQDYDAVFYDAKLKKQRELSQIDNDKIEHIAKKYFLESDDILYYYRGISKNGGGISRIGGWIQYNPKTNRFNYDVSPEITQEGIVDLWKKQKTLIVNQTGHKDTKRKSPEYPGLIYSIFKLTKDHTYKEIFDMYKNKQLPFYDLANTQLHTKDDLKRYYNKHRPDL